MTKLKDRLILTGVFAAALLTTIPIVFYYKFGKVWKGNQ